MEFYVRESGVVSFVPNCFLEPTILTHFPIQTVYKLFLTSCIIKLDYLRKAELT